MDVSFFKGIDDDHCFDAEATMVTSKNIQNLKCLYNYKCFVSGGERFFIMGLGVSVSIYVTHVLHGMFRHALSASHGLLWSHSHRPPGGRGGVTPLYGLYRYVPRNRVWFLEVLDP